MFFQEFIVLDEFFYCPAIPQNVLEFLISVWNIGNAFKIVGVFTMITGNLLAVSPYSYYCACSVAV